MKNVDGFVARGRELFERVGPEAVAAFDRLLADEHDFLRQDAVPLAFAELEKQRLQNDLTRALAAVRVDEVERLAKVAAWQQTAAEALRAYGPALHSWLSGQSGAPASDAAVAGASAGASAGVAGAVAAAGATESPSPSNFLLSEEGMIEWRALLRELEPELSLEAAMSFRALVAAHFGSRAGVPTIGADHLLGMIGRDLCTSTKPSVARLAFRFMELAGLAWREREPGASAPPQEPLTTPPPVPEGPASPAAPRDPEVIVWTGVWTGSGSRVVRAGGSDYRTSARYVQLVGDVLMESDSGHSGWRRAHFADERLDSEPAIVQQTVADLRALHSSVRMGLDTLVRSGAEGISWGTMGRLDALGLVRDGRPTLLGRAVFSEVFAGTRPVASANTGSTPPKPATSRSTPVGRAKAAGPVARARRSK